jgi:hypothetical protein
MILIISGCLTLFNLNIFHGDFFMKKFVATLFMVAFFLSTVCAADSNDNATTQQNSNEQIPSATSSEKAGVRKEYLAEQKVKMLPSKHGKTIDSYLTNMTRIPMAEDLGWKVYIIEDGYEVERSILINNKKTLRYKWKVSNSGEVSPVDDGARSLMK